MFRPFSVVAVLLLSAFVYRFKSQIASLTTVSALCIQIPFTDTWHTSQQPLSKAGSNPTGSYTRHIVAVGDLHGDLPNAKKVLSFAGVTDEFGDWSGNIDFFVQTGDIIDRGDDTIALFTWMERLREQATAAGATVLSALGNHEVMNAIGDWRYVYPSEITTFGGVIARQNELSKGKIGRAWASNYTIAHRLPLHPSIGLPDTPYPNRDFPSTDTALSHAALSFVHGGLSPSYEELTPFPNRINDIGSSFLAKLQRRKQPSPHPPSPYPGLPSSTTAEEARLYDENGPLWYRGWAMSDEQQVCSQVDDVLSRTGTRRMIMGHTPDFTGIVSRCKGKIIIIDTGISHAYGGVLSALSIRYTLTPIGASQEDGEQRWVEREVVSALYADHQEVIIENKREISGDFSL